MSDPRPLLFISRIVLFAYWPVLAFLAVWATRGRLPSQDPWARVLPRDGRLYPSDVGGCALRCGCRFVALPYGCHRRNALILNIVSSRPRARIRSATRPLGLPVPGRAGPLRARVHPTRRTLPDRRRRHPRRQAVRPSPQAPHRQRSPHLHGAGRMPPPKGATCTSRDRPARRSPASRHPTAGSRRAFPSWFLRTRPSPRSRRRGRRGSRPSKRRGPSRQPASP